MCIYRRVIIIKGREAIDLRKRGMGGRKGKERSSIFQVLYFKYKCTKYIKTAPRIFREF